MGKKNVYKNHRYIEVLKMVLVPTDIIINGSEVI